MGFAWAGTSLCASVMRVQTPAMLLADAVPVGTQASWQGADAVTVQAPAFLSAGAVPLQTPAFLSADAVPLQTPSGMPFSRCCAFANTFRHSYK